MSAIHPLFLGNARNAITTMREAGLNDTLIACCLLDIRAAAIMEERLRMEIVVAAHPPVYPRFGEILADIAETPLPPSTDGQKTE